MSKTLTVKITDLTNATGGSERKHKEKDFRSYNNLHYGSRILFYKTKLLSMGGHSL